MLFLSLQDMDYGSIVVHPHVSPMLVCSKCYPRALSYHRMTFYSGSTKNQTLKTHKNRAAKGVEGLVSLSTAKT